MKAPNKFISAIFILAILYLLYEVAMPSRKPKESSGAKRVNTKIKTIKKELLSEKKSIKKLLEQYSAHEEESLLKKERRKNLIWGKDPFLLPEALKPRIKAEKNTVAEKAPGEQKRPKAPEIPIEVTSILISGDEKVATINSDPYIVSIGDRIKDEKVINILPDKIIVEKNGKRRELSLDN
ncbi:MAG: hypothetical protein ACMUIP_03840 [bacterium]